MVKRSSFPRLKSPGWCLFWSLPFFVTLGIDIYIWLNDGHGFHFSETGYLIEHYLPDALPFLARNIQQPFLFHLIDYLLSVKTIILGGIISAVPILLLNRPRHGEVRPSFHAFIDNF